MTDEESIKYFQSMDDIFNQALVTNNIKEISKLLSDDWVLLEPQFGIIKKDRFLNAIEAGELSHTSMQKEVLWVKLHGDIALVTSRGMNIGYYKDIHFNSAHWVTNIYKNESENWTCIMTQEAPVSCNSS